MRERRTAGRQGGRKAAPAETAAQPGGAKRQRAGKAKVSLWLDYEDARKLRTVAKYREQELGDVAGPILRRGLSGVYVVDPADREQREPASPAESPLRIAEPAEPSEAAAGAEQPAA